jgi:hypothetical protein
MIRDLDTLYREYEAICIDRGAFAKSRSELHHNDESEWLTYVITLIAEKPSREERVDSFDP